MKHVLVVDDDPGTRLMISDYLGARDFRVTRAAGGAEMTRVLQRGDVDLVVLDVRLEAENGLELVRSLRTTSTTPVIIVTGQRRDETDRIVGLELGADDYLTKPFNLGELTARIRAVLRRVSAQQPERPGARPRRTYRFAGWRLRTRDRALVAADGGTVALSASESRLLMTFLLAPHQILSREQLLDGTGLADEVFDRSIDVQVLRLRRKLEADPTQPAIIKTARGLGYMLDADVTTE